MPAYVGSAYRRGDATDDGSRLGQGPRGADRGPAQGGVGDQVRRCTAGSRGSGVGLPTPARPARARHRRGAQALRPLRPALRSGQRRQRLEVGDGLPRRRLHGRGDPWRRASTGSRATAGPSAISASRSCPESRAPPTSSPTSSRSVTTARSSSCCRASSPDDLGDATWMPLTDSDVVARGPAVLLRLGQRASRRPRTSSAVRRSRCPHGTTPALSAAGVANQLAALGEFVDASFRFWQDVEDGGRAQGLNIFREPAALTNIGAAAENVSVWGSWQLDDDEALLIEVEPPDGSLLERRSRQPLVGDDRLRQSPVEPERVPGGARRRRGVSRGRVGTRPRRHQLARQRPDTDRDR